MFMLNIPRVEQEASFWCWAACGVMIGRHFGLNLKQCEIINRCFRVSTACSQPASANVPVAIPRITPELANWGLHNSRFPRLPPKQIAEQINASRPIIALVTLGVRGDGGGVLHTVLITGFDPGLRMVHRIDPFPGGGVGWVGLASMDWQMSWADFHL
jgi:hypothetical protein